MQIFQRILSLLLPVFLTALGAFFLTLFDGINQIVQQLRLETLGAAAGLLEGAQYLQSLQ